VRLQRNQSNPNRTPRQTKEEEKQLTESIKRCLPITLGLASNQLTLSLLLLVLSLIFSPLSPDAHHLIFANLFCSQLVGCFAMDGKPTEPKRESRK
jgi:hypothetical protein